MSEHIGSFLHLYCCTNDSGQKLDDIYIVHAIFLSLLYITVGGHYHVPVAGIGSVTLTIILPNGTSKLTFTNTLHIPILGADLISLGVLHHKGASVQSWEKGLTISKDGDDLFSAILGGSTSTLYQVQCTDFSHGSAHISAGTLSICLWHCRIEHLSSYIIDSMVY